MIFARGQRITVRGEDFLITDIDVNYDDTNLITTEGISELVLGKTFVFDTSIEQDIKPLDPLNTQLQVDTSTGYRRTKLFLETQYRNAFVNESKIVIGHKAALNQAPFQYEPTLKAFQLPRPRMLIADAVGLGKTLEVGIFLAEMIKRGRGKRILVLALKSILGQFQQEIWNRFAIPLVRLDSTGISNIKMKLPENKNPFDYYDKTIISIDTLKLNAMFMQNIEQTRWDIIAIDECHLVAGNSQRARLAKQLANQCESLILTSATPHNGKKESFAQLINMIEPIAIPRNGEFDQSHIDKYYVRRFKNDVDNEEVRAQFQERNIVRIDAPLYPEEEIFLEKQQNLKWTNINAKTGKEQKDFLFAISLFKSYMSSPQATLDSVNNRIEKLESKASDSDAAEDNIEYLKDLRIDLDSILKEKKDSKYHNLLKHLKGKKWKGKKTDDRYVIFAERIATLDYLKKRLSEDLKLKEEAAASFHGGFSDVQQQEIIEDFGKEDSKVRILLTSDAGSQGVNLHYYCHNMVNYDIPWSLITLEQRNGRIDRYGQQNVPNIYYLVSKAEDSRVKTDLHIVNKLTEKEEEVHKSIGDVGSVMKLYDAKEEEKVVTKAMKEKDFDPFDVDNYNPLADFILEHDSEEVTKLFQDKPIIQSPSFYNQDTSFYKDLIQELRIEDATFVSDDYLEVKSSKELASVLYDLPSRAKVPVGNIYKLHSNKDVVQNAIAKARKKIGEWTEFQMLYDLHPIIKYYMTKLEASVDKDNALVAKSDGLPKDFYHYVFHGQVTNKLGQSIISEFFVVSLHKETGLDEAPIPLWDFVDSYKLNKQLHTKKVTEDDLKEIEQRKGTAIEVAQEKYMDYWRNRQKEKMESDNKSYKESLSQWRSGAQQQIQELFKEDSHFARIKRDKEEFEVKTILDKTSQYYGDLTSLEQESYLKLLAVFYN